MTAQGAAACASEKAVIADFNSQLVTYISQFKANNTGVTTYLFDANTLFNTVLDNATAYGFVDNTSYGNTGDFWGNNYHPSPAMQTIIGQNVSSVLAGTPW
jgi:phospholipase/lecithinase/hemolysin